MIRECFWFIVATKEWMMRNISKSPCDKIFKHVKRVSVDVFEHVVRDGAFAMHWPAHGPLYGALAEIAQQRCEAKALLPDGLSRVIEIDNSGSLDETISEILTRLQPERA
jgi:ribose 1,5-bisphosphokinase PhnN